MKAPNVFAAVASSACAVFLAAGLAFAIEPTPVEVDSAPSAPDQAAFTTAIYEEPSNESASANGAEAGGEAAVGEVPSASASGTDAVAPFDEDDSAGKEAEATGEAGETGETTAPGKAAKSSESAAEADVRDALEPRTIDVDGDVMGYVDSFESASAPSSGAGLWMGADSTTDGSWGYFIGHNPGPFAHVMDLEVGDGVTICDSAGNTRTYHVIDTFTVPDSSYWEDISARVTCYGESIALQTCCGDHANYRIVVAV